MANTTYYISGTGDQLQLTTADQQKVNTVELSAQFDPSQDIAEASVYNSRGQFVNTTLVNVGLNLPSTPQDPNQSNEDRDLTSSTIFIDAVPLVSSLSDFEKDGIAGSLSVRNKSLFVNTSDRLLKINEFFLYHQIFLL